MIRSRHLYELYKEALRGTSFEITFVDGFYELIDHSAPPGIQFLCISRHFSNIVARLLPLCELIRKKSVMAGEVVTSYH